MRLWPTASGLESVFQRKPNGNMQRAVVCRINSSPGETSLRTGRVRTTVRVILEQLRPLVVIRQTGTVCSTWLETSGSIWRTSGCRTRLLLKLIPLLEGIFLLTTHFSLSQLVE